MSEQITDQITITYSKKRCCECGVFYAIESARAYFSSCQCPMCAGDEIKKANLRADVAERSARALRGIIKKLKSKRP